MQSNTQRVQSQVHNEYRGSAMEESAPETKTSASDSTIQLADNKPPKIRAERDKRSTAVFRILRDALLDCFAGVQIEDLVGLIMDYVFFTYIANHEFTPAHMVCSMITNFSSKHRFLDSDHCYIVRYPQQWLADALYTPFQLIEMLAKFDEPSGTFKQMFHDELNYNGAFRVNENGEMFISTAQPRSGIDLVSGAALLRHDVPAWQKFECVGQHPWDVAQSILRHEPFTVAMTAPWILKRKKSGTIDGNGSFDYKGSLKVSPSGEQLFQNGLYTVARSDLWKFHFLVNSMLEFPLVWNNAKVDQVVAVRMLLNDSLYVTYPTRFCALGAGNLCTVKSNFRRDDNELFLAVSEKEVLLTTKMCSGKIAESYKDRYLKITVDSRDKPFLRVRDVRSFSIPDEEVMQNRDDERQRFCFVSEGGADRYAKRTMHVAKTFIDGLLSFMQQNPLKMALLGKDREIQSIARLLNLVLPWIRNTLNDGEEDVEPTQSSSSSSSSSLKRNASSSLSSSSPLKRQKPSSQ